MKKFTSNLLIIALAFFAMGKVSAQDVVDLTASDDPEILADTIPDLSDGAIVLLKPGMVYNAHGVAFDKSITIQSSEPANLDRPKIDCGSNYNFGDGATVDSIIFRNLEFFDVYSSSGHYIINSDVSATIGTVMLDGCYIHDMRGIVRMKSTGPGMLENYIINNCMITMIRDYGLLTVDVDTWSCENIVIKNSTVSKAEAFLTSRNNSTSLLIDGCTFNEVPKTGQRMFRWRTSDQDSIFDGIMVKNTLWGTGWDVENTGGTAYDGYDGLTGTEWTFENTYATSDLMFDGDTIKGFNYTYPDLSTDLWANVSAGNLNYADTTYMGLGNAGDQRWGVATDDGGVEWNISADAFKYLGDMDSTRTVAGLTIFANPSKTVTIDANNKTVDDMSFTNRLKLGGSGDFTENDQPAGRVLSIDVKGNSMITVMAMSSSSSADRVLNIAAGNKDSIFQEFPALGASLTKGEYTYMGGPTKMFFYSPSSGVNVYYIKSVYLASTDATLSSLSVNIGTLDPEFDPADTVYSVVVPNGTNLVTLSATANDEKASLSGAGVVNVSSGSAEATVSVVAEDGTTMMNYHVAFTVLPDVTLNSLTVDPGTLMPAFDPDSVTYSVEVPSGTTSVTVSATANDAGATVSGTGDVDVSSGSGTASVVVTGTDGMTMMTYTVEITVLPSGIEDSHMKQISVYPSVSNGIFHVDFAGDPGVITVFDLTGRVVQRRNATLSLETVTLDRPGIYLINLKNSNESRTVRVVSVK